MRYLDECRALFGDERADYQAENWSEAFISEYATMHPWEDFAECFAHYLHITDTINTAHEAGFVLVADRAGVAVPRDIVPLASYAGVPIERLLYDWKWLALFFNRINTAMGKQPLYPFEVSPPVIRKLGFVHKVVRQAALAKAP